MISSMTAFARQSAEVQFGTLSWEFRSVNHRYLELALRTPEFFRDIEKMARETIQKRVQRGKVEAILRFQPGEEAPFRIKANVPLLEQLAEAGKTIASYFPASAVNVMDVLSWPGILESKEIDREAVDKQVLRLLDEALATFVESREREGEGIKRFLIDRLLNLEKGVKTIRKAAPAVLENLRSKLMARFEELSLALDKDRLEQEMVWMAQKLDVAEELQRLEAHIKEVDRVLKQGGVAGRRLDFLIQELNREANTLGSKSADAEITQVVVEMKVQIEQMREQVQNIE